MNNFSENKRNQCHFDSQVNVSLFKTVSIFLLANKSRILSMMVMFCIPVRLCVLERDFPPLLCYLARCRCAVTLFLASQHWHHPLRANCTDSQPTQRGLFMDVSGPRLGCFTTWLPPSQVCFHSPRTYCKHTHSLNHIPCGWRILYAKERTTRLTSLVLRHTHMGGYGQHWRTLKTGLGLLDTHSLLTQLYRCCHTCTYTKHTHICKLRHVKKDLYIIWCAPLLS